MQIYMYAPAMEWGWTSTGSEWESELPSPPPSSAAWVRVAHTITVRNYVHLYIPPPEWDEADGGSEVESHLYCPSPWSAPWVKCTMNNHTYCNEVSAFMHVHTTTRLRMNNWWWWIRLDGYRLQRIIHPFQKHSSLLPAITTHNHTVVMHMCTDTA